MAVSENLRSGEGIGRVREGKEERKGAEVRPGAGNCLRLRAWANRGQWGR